MVCSDRNDTPRPAITACLMVSLLAISITTFRLAASPPRKRSSAARVPEPLSRMMKGTPRSCFTASSPARTSGWSGAATNTCGCAAKGSARVASSLGGRPMMARSTSPASSICTSCSRLPTARRISTAGCSWWKAASSGGSMYLAVLTMPITSWPTSSLRRRATASSASFRPARMRRA